MPYITKKGEHLKFKELAARLEAQGVKNPNALAAKLERKQLGSAKLQKLAAAGKKKKAKK